MRGACYQKGDGVGEEEAYPEEMNTMLHKKKQPQADRGAFCVALELNYFVA